MKQRFFFRESDFVIRFSHDHLTVNFNRRIGCEIGPWLIRLQYSAALLASKIK